MPVVAGAGRGSFNHRFAQPSRDAQPLSPLFYPTDIPPFTDAEILQKAVAEKVMPKMMYVNTSYEFWSRGESLTYVQDGTTEVPLPSGVRLYTIAGMSHIGGPLASRPRRQHRAPRTKPPQSEQLLAGAARIVHRPR
jgi:hypothetical protein